MKTKQWGVVKRLTHETLTLTYVGSNPTTPAQTHLLFVNYLLRPLTERQRLFFLIVSYLLSTTHLTGGFVKTNQTTTNRRKHTMTYNSDTQTQPSTLCNTDIPHNNPEPIYQHQETENEEFFECQALYEEGMWC